MTNSREQFRIYATDASFGAPSSYSTLCTRSRLGTTGADNDLRT